MATEEVKLGVMGKVGGNSGDMARGQFVRARAAESDPLIDQRGFLRGGDRRNGGATEFQRQRRLSNSGLTLLGSSWSIR